MPDAPWKGRALPRLEDGRFLTGRGRYVDDIVLPNQLYAAFVRSPYPHARLHADVSAARSLPGVVAAYGGSDLADLGDVPPNWVIPGTKPKGRPPLARCAERHLHGRPKVWHERRACDDLGDEHRRPGELCRAV